MVFRQNRDGLAMHSPGFPQGFPKVSPGPPQAFSGFQKNRKFAKRVKARWAQLLKKKTKNPQGRPLRSDSLFENRRSPTQTEGRSRAARQAVGAARLSKPQFRRNASAGRPAQSGPRASIEPGGGAPRGPISEPLRVGRAPGPKAAEARGRLERRSKRQGSPKSCGDPALRLGGVGSRRRYRASLSSKGAKTPSLRMQVWPWDSNRGRSRLLTASISW